MYIYFEHNKTNQMTSFQKLSIHMSFCINFISSFIQEIEEHKNELDELQNTSRSSESSLAKSHSEKMKEVNALRESLQLVKAERDNRMEVSLIILAVIKRQANLVSEINLYNHTIQKNFNNLL